jgi:hypothetical protein
MGMRFHRVLLTVLVALAAIGIAWLAELELRPTRASAPVPSPVAGAVPREADALEPGSPDAREIPEPRPAEHEAESAARNAAHPSATVRARCLEENGLPIAGAGMEGDGGRVEATSGADGRIEGRIRLWTELGGTMAILLRERFHVKQRFSRVLRPDELCDLGDVVMPPAGCILGRVLDERGGLVAKAPVWSSRLPFAEWSSRQESDASWSPTGEDGSFTLEGVPCGTTRVAARARGYAPAERSPLAVLAGQELRGIEIVLSERRQEGDAGFVVRILKPTGEPLPTAKLAYDIREGTAQSSGNANVDGQGTRTLHCGSAGSVNARAYDPSGLYAAACAYDVPVTQGSLELRLGETRPRTLLVTDEQGEPVERYGFRTLQEPEWRPLAGRVPTDEHGLLRCSLTGGSIEKFPESDAERQVHAAGRAELHVPPLPFVIQVDAPEFMLAQIGPLVPESLEAEVHVALQRLPGVRGLVTADGKPVAGAWVEMRSATASNRETFVDDLPSRVLGIRLVSTKSGADGEFLLELRDAGDFEVQAGSSDRGIAELGPVHLVPNTGARDLVLELPALGAIEGRVLAAPGASVRDLVVGAGRGDGHAFSVRTDAEGRFRFEKLSPGPWLLRLLQADIDPNGSSSMTRQATAANEPLPSSCEVRPGETTAADIDLRQSAEIIALVQIAGWENARWQATLQPEGATQCLGARAKDVDGEHIRLRVDQPGEYFFYIGGQIPESKTGIGFTDRVRLGPGENTWSFASDIGGLVLENRTDGPAVASVSRRLEGARWVQVGAQVPAHSVLELGGIPVGTWTRSSWRDGKFVEEASTTVTTSVAGRLEWD